MSKDNNNQAVSTMLANTLKQIDPSVLSRILTPGKRSAPDETGSDDDEIGPTDKKPRAAPAPAPMNEYKGWTVPSDKFVIPTITLDESFTAEKFYKEYVSQRRPIVIRGTLEDLDGLKKWKMSNERLKNQAGKEKVVVEVRSDKNDTFGRGNQGSMSFSQFLDLVDAGDAMHYLTTQDVEADEGGRPDLLAPFMKALQHDFPLRPKLMGNLIPSNINIWMGNNKDGASSGLHHDYHDNLYIVLRGRKRFRLFSPGDTEKMYTIGALEKVHSNGRINYQGEITTAYGADVKANAAAKAEEAQENAERMLEEAEKAVAEGRPGAQEDLDRAEALLEEAMEAILDAEVSDNEEGLGGDNDDEDDDEDDIQEDEEEDGELSDQEKSGSDQENFPEPLEGRRCVDKSVKNPNNFSKIGAQMLDDEAELRVRFPYSLNAKAAFCDIKAGDILYLPASWFHEVTSFGEGQNGHMAMNYWFHPPDAENDFEHPYSTDFWPNDFKQRFSSKK